MSDSGWGGIIALGLLGLAIYSCSTKPSAPSSSSAPSYALSADESSVSEFADEDASESGADEDQRAAFDEDAAREKAEEELAGSTYVTCHPRASAQGFQASHLRG